MTTERICITGGLGFIGTAIRKNLLLTQSQILVCDNIHPQIHGPTIAGLSFSRNEEFLLADVRQVSAWKRIRDWKPSVIIHLAAETGTGQSMYEPSSHVDTNMMATALLCECVESMAADDRSSLKVVLSSSRAVYGEGLYNCKDCGKTETALARVREDLESKIFQPRCRFCRSARTEAVPTRESALTAPTSTYGFTKLGQEFLLNTLKDRIRTLGICRLQNVFGEGQSLKNPYTGILAIFSSLLRQGLPIRIFEDGEESRDFVHVSDVAQGLLACLNLEESPEMPINIGAGKPTSVMTIARTLAQQLRADSGLISISGEARLGDIRHNIADISFAEEKIGYQPKLSVEEGLKRFVDWSLLSPSDSAFANSYRRSLQELDARGQFVSGSSSP